MQVHLARVSLTPPRPPITMIGGADVNDAEDVRPSTRTTTPPSPAPPIAPPSPAQPTSLGRRLLGSIRALASHPAPPPAAAPKVGLGLLLHIMPDHPRLHPTPPASLSVSACEEGEDGNAAAAPPHAAASPVNRYRLADAAPTSALTNSRQWTSKRAPHLLQHLRPAADVAVREDQEAGLALVDGHGQDDQFCASGHLVGDKENVGEQQGAVQGQGTALVKDVAAAGDDQEEKACTGDQLRPGRDGDQERDAIHPRDGSTCCGIAAEDDQEKVEGRATDELGSAENDEDDDAVEDQEAVERGVDAREGEGAVGAAIDDQEEKTVQQCDTRELGTAENEGDDAEGNDQEAAEQGVIDTAMDDYSAVKDHQVVGQSVITGIEMHSTIHVQDQHKRADATVLSSEAVSAAVNGSDRRIGKQEKVKLPYPQRPGKLNCPFYMAKGSFSNGLSCHFHHPPLKAKPDGSWCPSEQGNHGVADTLELNGTGLHIREGAKNCTYYMRNGACRYGKRCYYNHPEHVSDAQFYAPTGWEDSTLKKSSDHHTIDDTSQLKKPSGYVTLDNTSYSTITLDHMPQQQQYPERPGQPDCRYYLQYGKCKFLSACMFHHPRDRLPVGWNPSGPAHSDQIGPALHGMPECPFYVKSGKCQFGSACEFRHPKYVCSTTEGALCHKTDLANDNFTRPENVVQKQEQTMYPERPGERRCLEYTRHGSCRFQMNCKYHHPADRLSWKRA
uniref:Uncharacterized protein n=1 Tax=Avena sativa TaxID=4498 RepID=A0ACD5YPA8_AVESA